jgi:hypothetical protein
MSGEQRADDALLAANVLWFAVVHALVAAYTFRRRVPVGVAAILVANAACVVGCLWASSAPTSVLETLARSGGFYVFVFVHFHVFQTRAQWDGATHATVGPHLGMHVLLADARLVLLSVCCAVFMCARVYLQNQDHHDSEVDVGAAAAQATGDPGDAVLEMEDMAGLLQELLAAKAGALEPGV